MRGQPWIALVCAAASVTCARAASESFPLRSKTLAALEATRPFDARISAAQVYRPCEIVDSTAVRGAGLLCRRTGRELASQTAEVAVAVSNALARQPTTDALWSAALLDLWSPRLDAPSIDRAIHRLLEVSARDSGRTRAAVLNDLAVAHLARASARSDARDLFTALDYAERAYASDSTSEVVRFNRAVILERLRIDAQATEAWRAVASSSDRWRGEAVARGRRITPPSGSGSPVTAGDPQREREYVLDSVMVAWANNVSRARADSAAATLRIGKQIGESLLARNGDSSVVHVIRELASDTSLARALLRGAKGAASYQQTRFVEARPELETSVRDLRSLRAAAVADWMELNLGALAIYQAEYAAAERIFSTIDASAKLRGDVALEARAEWGLALSEARRGAMSDVESAYSEAAEKFERLGETSNYAFMRGIIAEVHSSLGRTDEAAGDMRAALDAFHHRPNPGLRYALLLALGARLTDWGEPYAAAIVVREASEEARRTGRAKDVPEALARLATAESNVGADSNAKVTIEAARKQLTVVVDSVMRPRLDAEVARAEARVYRRDNPRRAIEGLSRAARYFAAAKIPSDEASALVDRASLRVALGDSVLAEKDLADATSMVAAFARSGANPETVRRLAATQRDAYRQLAVISMARGDSAAAYRYAVLSRARRFARRDSEPLSDPTLPAGTALLEFLSLERGTLVWTTTRAGRRLDAIAEGRGELSDLVRRFVNLVRQGDDTLTERTVASRLYETLLKRPLGSFANEKVHRIVIVTDDALSDLPFAALRTSAGRYVVEDYSVVYSESGRGANSSTRATLSDALLVGNPAWDHALFPELEPLPRTSDEIRAVGALYEQPAVLTAATASRDAVRRELGLHDLVHFAGHARVVGENPGASHLVLAKAPGGFGANVLFASEIAVLPLRRLRLVVLSACGEARDAFSRSEGNGLVEAFLDAGARGVIASQWEAEDDATAALTQVLHRELRSGVAPDEALRRAQVALVGAGGAKSARRMWSGFRYTTE